VNKLRTKRKHYNTTYSTRTLNFIHACISVLTHLMYNVNYVQYYVTQNPTENTANKQKHTHMHILNQICSM